MMNRFKGLDLVDRVPEELWTDCTRVSEQTIPKKTKCKKAKWLSEEALQTAEKRREGKKQRTKGKIHPMNAEIQRKARRDKKTFFHA